MQLLTFHEYEMLASEAVAREPYPKQFQSSSPGSEAILKRHPGQIWRPIQWCDKCKADIQMGLAFNPETREALCYRCAGIQSDKDAAAALGIAL